MRKATAALMVLVGSLGVTMATQIYKVRGALIRTTTGKRAEHARWRLDVSPEDPRSATRYRRVCLTLRQDPSMEYLLRSVAIRHGRGIKLHRPQESRGEGGHHNGYAPRVDERMRRLESRQMSIRQRRSLETDERSLEASFFVSVPTKFRLNPVGDTRLRLTVVIEEVSERRRPKRVTLASDPIPWTARDGAGAIH